MFTILGFLHRSGVSQKTGKNYDFWEVHYSFIPSDRFRDSVTGQLVDHKICSADFVKSVTVGEIFDNLYFDAQGAVVFAR